MTTLRPFLSRLLLAAVLAGLAPLAWADRVKDLAQVATVRSNQLIGYGLVVGLQREVLHPRDRERGDVAPLLPPGQRVLHQPLAPEPQHVVAVVLGD